MKTRTKHKPASTSGAMPVRRKQIKDVLIVLKVSRDLAFAIDEEGERLGLTRSAIVRGTLLEKFRHAMPAK